MGAWIETPHLLRLATCLMTSHPSWVRGLKLLQPKLYQHQLQVAPLVGAWIETSRERLEYSLSKVAPLVGAWIETDNQNDHSLTFGRTPRGCVD